MQRMLLATACLMLAAFAPGCGAQHLARQIVEYNTRPGAVAEDLAGSAENLIKAGRIDLHRRCRTQDDINIDVWVVRAKQPPASTQGQMQSQGTVVILHGLAESKASFPYLGAAQRLARKGYDVVLPDLRAHGRSEGKYVTYGFKEKYDVKAVADALLAAGEVREPIYAFGATLGGATAIQYAAIDPRCKGVFAIAPYLDARTIARRRLMMHNDKEFQAAFSSAGKLAGFDPQGASAVEAAKKLTVPLLLSHGMIDLTVPPEHSDAIYQAAGGPKKIIRVTPGPEQLAMFAVMEDWIADRMDELIKTGLKQKQD